jgi:hypothetical protein
VGDAWAGGVCDAWGEGAPSVGEGAGVNGTGGDAASRVGGACFLRQLRVNPSMCPEPPYVWGDPAMATRPPVSSPDGLIPPVSPQFYEVRDAWTLPRSGWSRRRVNAFSVRVAVLFPVKFQQRTWFFCGKTR